MANTLSVSPFGVGSTISGSGHLSVIEDFKHLPGKTFPFLSRVGYSDARKLDDAYRLRWITSEHLPTFAVLNEGLDSSETGVDVTAATAATVQNGQVIRIDDELMRVTSGAGTTTWTVERDYAGSTAATHSSGANIQLMAPQYLSTDSFVESAKLRGDFASNYPAQFMYFLSQDELSTSVVSYFTGGENEKDHEKKKKKQIEVSRQFEATLLYSMDQQPTGAASGSMAGVLDLIATNRTNVAAQALNLSHFEDMLATLADLDDSLDSLTLCMSRKVRRIVNALFLAQGSKQLDARETSLGVRIDTFQTPLGDLSLMVVPQLDFTDSAGRILTIAKWDDIKVVPIDTKNGSGWKEVTRGFSEANALVEGWGYWGIFTLVIMNEKRHGQIYNFDTALPTYGAI